MLVHSVYFWLKPDLSAADRATFDRLVAALKGAPSVKQIFLGVPAATERRPIIDSSYSVALTLVFDDVAGHDAYQIDPVHLAFVNACRTFWTRVQIYDAA